MMWLVNEWNTYLFLANFVIPLIQDMMVDENILKLEIKRLRDLLNNKADEVLSLEKRKLQLETAMKERRHEIDIHKDMLKAQLKATDEERSQISTELHDRISKIDKLRKRYTTEVVESYNKNKWVLNLSVQNTSCFA